MALISEAGGSGEERFVDVRGEIDVGSTPTLRDWLTRASGGGRRAVVVDLRGVEFLAISGLYVLCDEAQRMARHRVRLTIVCSDARALQLFAVCQLDEVLRIVPALDPAAPPEPWGAEDEARAARLTEWLQRYSAESA